jgi:hypothetical protein
MMPHLSVLRGRHMDGVAYRNYRIESIYWTNSGSEAPLRIIRITALLGEGGVGAVY